MEQLIANVKKNEKIAKDIFLMILEADIKELIIPGQFINIKIEGFYLRRPISICDYDEKEKRLFIIYKIFGEGTLKLSKTCIDTDLDILCGLGNGFDFKFLDNNLKISLIGGGVGLPPIYFLAKVISKINMSVNIILGFKDLSQVFYTKEISEFGKVHIATEDGSIGQKGFVTDILKTIDYDYYFTCGPKAMLKSVYDLGKNGQLSLEERMACGFGACMGCTCRTNNGPKRICTEGPVFKSDEVIFYE